MRTLAAAMAGAIGTLTVLFVPMQGWGEKPPTPSELQKQVVYISDSKGHGTGVIVAKDTILTAKHVTDNVKAGGETGKVTTFSGKTYEFALVKDHPFFDLSLITLKKPIKHAKIATLSCVAVLPGGPLQAVGHPIDSKWGYYRFTVVGGTRQELDHPLVQGAETIQGPTVPGISGAPAFNEAGEVVGIVNSAMLNNAPRALTGVGTMISMANACAPALKIPGLAPIYNPPPAWIAAVAAYLPW